MKICAIICELNPMHNGHQHIFDEARKITNCDYLLAIMGGNFCQRAEYAIVSKQTRTKCALACGADAVIELPAIYATASSDMFAKGAITILNTIPNVTHLVMGSESGDMRLLSAIADAQSSETAEFQSVLRSQLDAGKSYAKAITTACAQAINDYSPEEIESALNCPNNILAVAYKKMLNLTGSSIEFLPIKRVKEHMSASQIRKDFFSENTKLAMPRAAYDITAEELARHSVEEKAFSAIVLHALKTTKASTLAACPDCSEGLENRILNAAINAVDYEQLIASLSSARYTNSRIRRICLHNLLGITKSIQNSGYKYAKLLGIKESAKQLLGVMPKNIITNKSSEASIPKKYAKTFNIDILASNIYAHISGNNTDGYYTKLITDAT